MNIALEQASFGRGSNTILTPCSTFTATITTPSLFSAVFAGGSASETFTTADTSLVAYTVALVGTSLSLTFNDPVTFGMLQSSISYDSNTTTAETPTITGFSSYPGQLTTPFDPLTNPAAGTIYTAYGNVTVSATPSSNIAVVTINGVVASTATVQLSMQASQITVGLQSSQYQCAIGSGFTVTAQQVPLTLASFATTGYVQANSILSSYDTIEFTALPSSVYTSCNATFDGAVYACGEQTKAHLTTTPQSLSISISVLSDQPPMFSGVTYTATYEECMLTQFDFEISAPYNCTTSSVSDSSTDHAKCIATTSAGDAASFVWSTANCSNAQLLVLSDGDWVESDDKVTLKTGVNSYQVVFSTYSNPVQTVILALADVAYTDVDTTISQASTVPAWSSSVQTYQVSVPCLSFSVSTELSNGTGYEALIGDKSGSNTFLVETVSFKLTLSNQLDSTWPTLSYTYNILNRLCRFCIFNCH